MTAPLQLELYVVGQSPASTAAVANLRRLCAHQLLGRCRLVVIDVLDHPEAAEAANIVATPTLIRRFPMPVRRIVGDLSKTETVMDVLEADAPAMQSQKDEGDDRERS